MNRTQEALQFICPDDRDVWVSMGMAVKSEHGDAGFDVWEQWSMQSASYSPASAKSVWRSIRPSGGVTIGSLIHEARANGWRDDNSHQKPTHEEIEERKRLAAKRFTEDEKKVEEARALAARKAAWLLSQAELDIFGYMDAKGMPDVQVNVWRRADQPPVMLVPMYYRAKLCGVQVIDTHGSKKFLTGQRTSEAYLKIGEGRKVYLVEGYASALSLKAILTQLRIPLTIYVCFSAGNMAKLANLHREAMLICDHDESGTGQKVGEESGCKYWYSDVLGDDINDYLKRVGLFRATQDLKSILMSV